jgi:hypothetical protein
MASLLLLLCLLHGFEAVPRENENGSEDALTEHPNSEVLPIGATL